MHVIKIATFYNSGLLRLEVASAAKEKAKLAKAALLRSNIMILKNRHYSFKNV